MDNVPIDLRDEFSSHEASNVTEKVLWPVRFHGHDCN